MLAGYAQNMMRTCVYVCVCGVCVVCDLYWEMTQNQLCILVKKSVTEGDTILCLTTASQ